MDTVLNEFLNRFGSFDQNKFKTQNRDMQGNTISLSESELNDDSPIIHGDMPDSSNFNLKEIGNKATGLLEMTPEIMALADNISGNQYNTEANSEGPGRARGHIIKGASDGMQLGDKVGSMFGPKGKIIGQGIGALAGGLTSVFTHKDAVKKYKENMRKANLKEDALEKAKREETYRMEEGLFSMNALKNLKERQLGTYTG